MPKIKYQDINLRADSLKPHESTHPVDEFSPNYVTCELTGEL